MNLKNRKILVTGAGGFIGSHLTEELVRLGANVSCFVKYNSRNDFGMLEELPNDVKKKLNIIAGDLNDYDAVQQACHNMDVVFHLAALIAIPYSYKHHVDVFNTNIHGTLNVLNACMREKVKKVVHTSTSEVYGTAKRVPIDENHPLQAQSPYSASKIGADKMAESFYLSFDLPVATIRPFNAYGPRQSARAVIPTIITQALTKKEINLGSLHPKRDFTFVKDTVNGFIRVAESEKSIGRVINVGSNTEISIGELAEKIASIIGKHVTIKTDNKRKRPDKSEVDRLLADNTLARELIGWKPSYSLDKGLKETIEYISKNLDKYKVDLYNI